MRDGSVSHGTVGAAPARSPATLFVNDLTKGRVLTIRDLMIGDAVEQEFVFDASIRSAFKIVANDRAPVHEDDRFAHSRGFGGTIIQGLCVSTRFSRLIGMYLPGENAILESISLKYRRPTYEGQPIRFRAQVDRLLPRLRVVRMTLTARSDDALHVSGEAQCLIR